MDQWLGSWRENCRHSWRMFTRALPLLFFWLVLPGCLLLTIFATRSVEPFVRRTQLPAISRTLAFANTFGSTTTLRVSFPQEVSADPLKVPSQVISVQAVRQGLRGLDMPVIVSVECPEGGLALVDEQGYSFPQPAYWVVSTGTLTSPAHIYFHLLPASTSYRREISLQFRLLSESGKIVQPNKQSQSVLFTVEPAWVTWLFRVAGLEGGLATAGVGLLTLVGFGVQQWSELAKEEEVRRQEREEALMKIPSALAEIESLRGYLRDGRFDDALECYEELRDKKHPPWQDEVIRERLKVVWREASPRELQSWVLIRGRITQEASQEATRLEAEQ